MAHEASHRTVAPRKGPRPARLALVTLAARALEELVVERHDGKPVTVDAAAVAARVGQSSDAQRLRAGLTPRQLPQVTPGNVEVAVATLLALWEHERYARADPKNRDVRRFVPQPDGIRFLTDRELDGVRRNDPPWNPFR